MANSLTHDSSHHVDLTIEFQTMTVMAHLRAMGASRQGTIEVNMGTRNHLLGKVYPVDPGWEVECKPLREDKAGLVEGEEMVGRCGD